MVQRTSKPVKLSSSYSFRPFSSARIPSQGCSRCGSCNLHICRREDPPNPRPRTASEHQERSANRSIGTAAPPAARNLPPWGVKERLGTQPSLHGEQPPPERTRPECLAARCGRPPSPGTPAGNGNVVVVIGCRAVSRTVGPWSTGPGVGPSGCGRHFVVDPTSGGDRGNLDRDLVGRWSV